MKQIPKNNRNRQRSGRRPSGGGGGGGNNVGHNLNRVYESNGPEGRVRGTAQQLIEKYSTLGRDAMTTGDRIVAENFLQHAEHYQRIVATALAAEAEAQERRQQQQAAQQEHQNRSQNGNGQQSNQNPSHGNGNGQHRGNGASEPHQPRHERAESPQIAAAPIPSETAVERPAPAPVPRPETIAEANTPERHDPLAGDPRLKRDEAKAPEVAVSAASSDAEPAQAVPRKRRIAPKRPVKAEADPSIETAPVAVDDEAPAAPKKRGRPRKKVAEADIPVEPNEAG